MDLHPMNLLEALKRQLNLKLNDSEVLELQEIDRKLDQLPYESPAIILDQHLAVWLERREKTVEAYRLKREAKDALDLASASHGDRNAWMKAHQAAQASDVILKKLLVYKLRDRLMSNGGVFHPESHTHMIVTIGLCIVLVDWLLIAMTSIDREAIKQLTTHALSHMMLPFILFASLFAWLETRDDLVEFFLNLILSHHDLSDEVLRLALDAGVDLCATGQMLADSSSLISHVINRRNNGTAFDAINHMEVPLEYCCAIGKDVMTDPVYSKQNPERFERTSILAWLAIKATHPVTGGALSADDLKRDFPLKLKIDAYVDDKIEAHQKDKIAQKALPGLSLFSATSKEDELGELYQHKFC
jgi:hypothetical protein